MTRLDHQDLLSFTSTVFSERGLPRPRAERAAQALVYGDLNGLGSHGLANLSRLYLPLLAQGRADPAAEPITKTDLGACALVDAGRALGLWAAAEAMDSAIDRARRHGIGLVSVHGGTHFGCAGFHAALAAEQNMIGVVASNCGGQRIARPPGGAVPLLGTNPLAVAAPALPGHPYVLDMSTTVVPTGRIRAAARAGHSVPAGWLADDTGATITDPAAFDRGEAHLRWLGGNPETGAYKGFGLGLAVELLAALLPGAALGPAPGPDRDDDIGYLVLAISPDALRAGFPADARSMFEHVLAAPTLPGAPPVRYPGWAEAERAAANRAGGVPVADDVYRELLELGFEGASR